MGLRFLADMNLSPPDMPPHAHHRIRRGSARRPSYWGPPLALALLFWGSARVSEWASFDQAEARSRMLFLTAGLLLAAGVMVFVRMARPIGAGLVALAGGPMAAAIGGYFLATYDWQAQTTVKSPLLWRWGTWVQAHLPAFPVPEPVHPNVIAGALILFIALGAGGLLWWLDRRGSVWNRMVAVVAGAALALALIALILTASRGAWAGLILASLWGVVLSTPRPLTSGRGRWLLLGLTALTLLPALAFLLTLIFPGLGGWWGDVTGAGGSAMARADLWRNSLTLIRDYPFTGSGLGLRNTSMVYSTYVLLLSVNFLSHMHNLFLQVAVEQGLAGLAALLGGLALAGWSLWRARRLHARHPALIAAAAAGLVAVTVHGLVDAGFYTSRLAPLFFLSLGYAISLRPTAALEPPAMLSPLLWSLPLLLALLLLVPSVRAAFAANLGAATQTRAELSVYDFHTWGFQDAVRRDPGVDLAPALARYDQALALNPANETALRRLGQIALSRGEYDAADGYLTRAASRHPHASVNRKLLGEILAVHGRVEEAAGQWRGFTNASSSIDAMSLQNRVWWHAHLGEEQIVAWMKRAMALSAAEDFATNGTNYTKKERRRGF